MVFALVFIGVSFAAVGMAWWLAPKREQEKVDADMDVLVALHGVRRRTEVFMFKAEVARYAQYAERQIRRELQDIREAEALTKRGRA